MYYIKVHYFFSLSIINHKLAKDDIMYVSIQISEQLKKEVEGSLSLHIEGTLKQLKKY